MPYCEHGKWLSECILCRLNDREEGRLRTEVTLVIPRTPRVPKEKGKKKRGEKALNVISLLPLPVERICSICRQPKKKLNRNRKSKELICNNCYRKDPTRHEECSRCGKIKRVVTRNKLRKAICNECYHKDTLRHEKCSKCSKLKQVVIRDKLERAICNECYHRDPKKHEKCSKCSKLKQVVRRNELGEAICKNCCEYIKIGECNGCKVTKGIHALGLCAKCYRRRWHASLKAKPV